MKKTLRNLVIGAAMAIGVFAASSSAFAYTQYTQTDMNFRKGPSTTATIIGSVPEGAKVDVIESRNGWDLVTYNGVTGYIHGGNVADSYSAPAYEASNEIGRLYTGDLVQRTSSRTSGSYIEVYSPKYNAYGWVNAGFLS